MTKTKWTAQTWVEAEIDALIDSYGSTRVDQAKWILGCLSDGEYRDELDDRQVAAAKTCILRTYLMPH